MPSQISKGETFTDVSPGKSVTSTRLNDHVDNATILPGAITEQTDISTAIATDDLFLMSDTSASGALKKVQAANLLPPEVVTSKTDISTAIASDDLFLVSDTSVSGALKKVLAQNILPAEVITAKTDLAAAIAADDYLLVSDTSASGALKKVAAAALFPPTPTLSAGMVYQIVTASDGTAQTLTTAIVNDDSIPQSSEGAEILTVAITPRKSTSTLIITACAYAALDTNGIAVLALFKDADAGAIAAGTNTDTSASGIHPFVLHHSMTAGTTSAITFKLRIGENGGGNVFMHGGASNRKYGGVLKSFIRVEEVAV